MARKRSMEQTHRGFHTGAVPSTSTPTACPVCGETPAVAKGEKQHQVLEAHIMAQHRPDVACQREHRDDAKVSWKLDWDAVIYQSQKFLWYCVECGFYLKSK
jgi:hypothetical protein